MAEPFIGEVRMFGGNFAPRGWAFCDGQLLSILDNDALFQLIGTTYGGDGQVTFALPDLRGRIPIHTGQGPGLSDHDLAEFGGSETVTLIGSQLPAHLHGVQATSAAASQRTAAGNLQARTTRAVYHAPAAVQLLSASAIGAVGGGQAHENLQPYLCVNFIIAIEGIFPLQG